MALNYPGPYEIRMFYDVTISGVVRAHEARYNCVLDSSPAPGDGFDIINVVTRSSAAVGLDTYMDAWVSLFLGLYPTTAVSVAYAELWQYTPESFLAEFVSTYDISTAGVGGSNLNPAGQLILTYRTLGGGIMKQSFMESVVLNGGKDTPPYANAAAEAIRAFTISTANAWLARDTTYPFASIAAFPGQNEALFKSRYRDA